ncbi:KTSC domain-containing protein [Janthinobacterium sp.]|uniref:KTSC domain-containing protein n=1 Tax=Janthinobacterium sp. TaxID=1871054 RepID=UPI002898A75A|nr:KTSC domain-containing protein [Janthinobacterium sp.]
MSTLPKIVMHQVESSQFAAIGHAPELNLLAIQFHPKKSTGQSDIYHYQNFSADLFAEFLGADSQGSFFIQRIKKYASQFPYSKIDQAAFNHTAPQPAVKPAGLAEAPPVKLSKELLAGLLTGREYMSEMFKEEEQQAKAAGLLVIFGASGDLMVFRGARRDELAAGIAMLAPEPAAKWVEALFGAEPDYSWTFRTDVPHATFEIVEGGEPYCRGIVIDVADLAPAGRLEIDHTAALEINARCYGEPLPHGQRYSRTTFKDNGDPILLGADGKRSVFCDLCDDVEDAA